MKYIFILFTSLFLFLSNLKAQISYTWNGVTSSNWGTNTNWTPNGIPGPTDNVTIVTGANNCIISANTIVNNLVINSGVLNIGAFTFSVNGTTNAVAGTVAATTGTLFCSGATVNFGNGSGGPTINSIVNVSSPSILTQRTTYNNTVVFTKTEGSVSNASTGGNTFNSSLTMNYFSSVGSGYWSMGHGISDIYNGNLTLNNNSLDRIILCHNSSTNQFNGNIHITQTGSSVGTSLSWNNNTGGALASGRTITTGTYDVGYLYLQGITQTGPDAINISTTGTSQVWIGRGNGNNTNIFNGPITITAPRIWASGSTYNNNVTFNKTGAGDSHNDQRQNIFNGTVEINNTSTGYFMLGYNSNDLFNENIIVSSTNTGGINLGWINASTSSPVLASGKTILVGSGGFNAGTLRFGGFAHLGAASSINLVLTGTAAILINRGTSNTLFEGSFSVSAPDITLQGGTFNGPAVFTKTGGTSTHNNGFQNIFNSTCTINQQSNTGYFMLGYNSNCLFNDDIVVTSSGTNGIYLGFSSGTGTPTLASGKTIIIGGAGFNSGFLYLGGFTQLGSAPINLNFAGVSTALTLRASTIGGNFTSTSGNLILNGNTFLGSSNFTKTGTANDASAGGNTFNGISSFTKNGTGYLLLGNTTPDIWNSDVSFTNSNSERILPAWNSSGNQFNGNITVSSTGSSTGIQFCGGSTVATATLSATKTINTGTFDSGYLILPRFTQLGSQPINLNLTTTSNYLQFGPNSFLGGNITATSPNIRFDGCNFNGTSNFTFTGVSNYYSPGGNTFNGTSSITHNGTGFLLLGNTSPDLWNSDVTFTNNSNERILPAWGSVGNLFNGNIFVNTLGSAQGIQFCGGNATATATLAATKTIAAGALGLNAGYLILKQFTQLGNTPINLTMSSTASFIQYGPLSNLGGNVTSVSPRLLFNGCVFNGTTNCTKNGSGNDASIGGNIFTGVSEITNSGSGYFYLGNGSSDQFITDAIFNNIGTADARFYFAHSHNSQTTTFGGNLTLNSNKNTSSDGWSYLVAEGSNTSFSIAGNLTINNTGALQSNMRFLQGAGTSAIYNGNLIINLTNSHTSTQIQMGNSGVSTYQGNILVQNTSGGTGSGVFFNAGAAASSTLAATRTISLGAGGFVSGDLSLIRFTQISATPQTLIQTTGNARLILGPTSSFDGNVNFNFPQVLLNGTTYNGLATIEKNGAGDNDGIGGNVFNGTTVITNSGSGRLQTGSTNRDQFNALTTFNNTGSARFHFAQSHTAQTTTFAQDFILNSNKSGGTDAWSFFTCEGTNTSVEYNGSVTYNVQGSLQSNCRVLQGASSTATYNGNLIINLTNSHASTQIQMGTVGLSSYNGNITVQNTAGGTGSGVFFNTGASASSNLAATRTISLGAGGFVSGDLSLIRFTQVSATPQTLIQTTGNARLILGPTSSFDGNVNFNFPQVFLNGTTYNGLATIEKNGATDNAGNGGNIFNGTTVITNSGTGYLMTGNTTRDEFNALTTFNNTGSHSIYFAHNHGTQTTVFNSDLILNSNKNALVSAWGYWICEGTNTSVLYNGNVTYNIQGAIQTNCRTLNGIGSTAIYNGNLNINLSNSHASTQIQMGINGINNYNGNIVVQNTAGGTGSGVFFNVNSSASSTLAATRTISLGAGGFVSGDLSLIRFTQVSATPQTLTQTTGNARLILGPTSLFDGNVNFNFPQLFLNGTTYNGTAVLQKNGATDNSCVGGNIFNGITEIINSSSNFLRLANTSTDSHNSDVTFTQNANGVLAPNFNANCTYLGNVSVNSTSSQTITFGSGTGIATITGSNAQSINKTGTAANPNFTRLTINKASNDVTLNTRINVTNTLSLIQGLINTSTTNILNMNDLSNTSIGNTMSYVNGPMQYAMASNSGTRRSLNLPIGKATDWRPAIIQVSHTTNTNYTYRAEVFNASAEALGWTKPATVSHVSYMHYWDIDRFTTSTMANASSTDLRSTIGVNGPIVTLYYGANDGVTDPSNLTICKNTNGALTTWIDIGGTGATLTAGNVTSTSAPSNFNSFSRFTLANIIGGTNPLPVELVEFNAVKDGKQVDLNWITASETNNSHFEIEKSKDGVNFEKFTTVKAYGDGNSWSKQLYKTIDEKPYSGISYYRLKQIDKDKSFSYSPIQLIEFNDKVISIYPNPTSGIVNIKYGKESKLSFVIYNSAGEKVMEGINISSDINSIDLSNLANGIYSFVIELNGEIKATKLTLLR